jgi:exonuclease III
MKLLSWNCSGLGKASAVRAIRQLILTHHPDMIFLTETKFQSCDFNKKANSFGPSLSNCFVVDCTISPRNRKGGLALFLSKDVKINIIGFNENMIDYYVHCDLHDKKWRATGIYGYPKHNQKHLTCDLISQPYLSNNHDDWLVFGDFNLIFNSNEKQGAETPLSTLLI